MPDADAEAARTLSILYAEDDPDLRALAELILAADPSVRVRTAADGAAALDALASATAEGARFDALCIDAALPPPDGPEVVRRLRADPAHAGLVILFCTGRSGEEDRTALLACGADAVLVKPLRIDRLPQEIRRIRDARA